MQVYKASVSDALKACFLVKALKLLLLYKNVLV